MDAIETKHVQKSQQNKQKKIDEIHVQVVCLLVPEYDDRTGFVSTNLNNQCLMYRGIYQESLWKFFSNSDANEYYFYLKRKHFIDVECLSK